MKKPARRRNARSHTQTRMQNLVQPDLQRSEHSNRQARNIVVHDEETSTNPNPDTGMGRSMNSRANQGSRFRALSELHLNVLIGEEHMEEDSININTENVSVNGDQNKKNLPREDQVSEMLQEMCKLHTPRGPTSSNTQQRRGPAQMECTNTSHHSMPKWNTQQARIHKHQATPLPEPKRKTKPTLSAPTKSSPIQSTS